MRLAPLTLVIGGASSGKSAYAERLIRASGLKKIYIATAKAFDDEMAEKIAAHRAARSGDGWTTREAPLDVAGAMDGVTADHGVLLDCATLWLSNLVLAETDPAPAVEALIDRTRRTDAPMVIVSNEVGAGIVPDTRLGRAFRGVQGRANQRVAAEAQSVIQITAGLPLALKGRLPDLSDAP